ncbi:uncharacterized protein LOC143258616 [Tachypleus tridentatus]|uniref:uncharacterized protein LOC143258616 n=1 Tax=Tachypleus tridentatus TaxID=6853 RepID=UPI003FD4DFFD
MTTLVPAQAPVPSLSERLRQAAVAGQADKVQELFKLGAKIETDAEGRTALHLAAANGYVDTVKTLLQCGAKVNAVDQSGYSPLHQAATEGHVEVVRLLLKNGSHVDAQDEMHGNTASHEAAWKGYSQTLEVLCKNKANVYIKNKGGFSALHLACQSGHNQSSRVLLLAGCKPDIKNNYGDTPLHTAARYGHAGVLRILISAFCHVSEVNKNGDTALHIATAMGRRKLTRILLEAGCDQSLQNKQGEVAMEIAKRKEFAEIVEILSNPPPRVIKMNEKKEDKKSTKKREKDSGTSQGSKDSSCKLKKEKKKSKRGHKVHFPDEKGQGPSGHWSPYGCHMFPNLANFPDPKLDSLPPEPLKKGEQYYVDLAGRINKGPVGVGYTCYCAPFFRYVEKKMESDKQELIDHIDNAHDDLHAKIAHLERRTRSQLFNLNQSVKEKLANERTECVERMERRTSKERQELEKQQGVQMHNMKTELQSWLESKRNESENKTTNPHKDQASASNNHIRHPTMHHWSLAVRKKKNSSSVAGLMRSKSEELLSEADGDSALGSAPRVCSPELHGTISRRLCSPHFERSRNGHDFHNNMYTRVHSPDTHIITPVPRFHAPISPSHGKPNDLANHLPVRVEANNHQATGLVQRLQTDFEKLGARPKFDQNCSPQQRQSDSAVLQNELNDSVNPDNLLDIKRDSRSDGDLRTYNGSIRGHLPYLETSFDHPNDHSPASDSGYQTKMSPSISDSSGAPYQRPPAITPPHDSHHPSSPTQVEYNQHHPLRHSDFVRPQSTSGYSSNRAWRYDCQYTPNSYVHYASDVRPINCTEDQLYQMKEELEFAGETLNGSSLV